jgi:hypothetical protein
MATGTLGGSGRDYHTRQTHYLAAQIRVDNLAATQAVTLGTIPANAAVVRLGIVISTAFNAGTNNNVSFGDVSSSTRYAAAATGAATLGLTTYTVQATAAAALATADTVVQVVGAFSGTAATAGTGIAFCEYLIL